MKYLKPTKKNYSDFKKKGEYLDNEKLDNYDDKEKQKIIL